MGGQWNGALKYCPVFDQLRIATDGGLRGIKTLLHLQRI
jgi:hypothetical protein